MIPYYMQKDSPNIKPLDLDAVSTQRLYKTMPEDYFIEDGKNRSLVLRDMMAERVPAYKKLYTDNLNITEPKNIILSKDSYLKTNKIEDLCWDGNFKEQSWVISSTSGSTGEPYYFPRQTLQDSIYALTAEIYLRENFNIQTKSTLYIVAFPLGAWIGGIFTYEAIKQVASHGYNITIITPGINKIEIINSIIRFGSSFDQIVIGVYAPFLRDIIDEGDKAGIDWSKLNTGFVFSAEGFSEQLRDYINKKIGLEDIYKSTLNHYGTVDLGTMAHETPLTILIRRLALKNPSLYKDLFGDNKSVTLCQFDPRLFYFEEFDGVLHCSAYGGIPLYRYNLKDNGGILFRRDIDKAFSDYSIDLSKEINDACINDTVWNLPFVFVKERSDFSVSYYAFQVYPDTIKKALLANNLTDLLTGRFVMRVYFTKLGRQRLEVNVELKNGLKKSLQLKKDTSDVIHTYLYTENSEYRKTCDSLSLQEVKPIVRLHEYGTRKYFKLSIKQKWSKK